MPIAKMTLKRLKRTLLNLESLHMLFLEDVKLCED